MAFDLPLFLRRLGRFALISAAFAAGIAVFAALSVPAAAFALAFLAVIFGRFARQAAADSGRRLPVRFGEALPENRTGTRQTPLTAPADTGPSQEEPFVGCSATLALGRKAARLVSGRTSTVSVDAPGGSQRLDLLGLLNMVTLVADRSPK